MRNGPTGRTGQKSQSLLQGNIVYLIYNAVNVVRQISAHFHQAVEIFFDLFEAVAKLVKRIGREAPGFEVVEKIFLRIPDALGDFSPGVGEDAQFAFGSNLRIQLAQRTGSSVTRIGKGFFSFIFVFLIKGKKV